MGDDGHCGDISIGASRAFVAEANGHATSSKSKSIFIARDYSHGLNVRFDRQYPKELDGLVMEEDWFSTIDTINAIFEEAEKVCCASVFETLMGCVTCYLMRCFTYTRYEKKLLELSNFVDSRNSEIFAPVGLYIRDPMLRGLRVLEISYLHGDSSGECTEYRA